MTPSSGSSQTIEAQALILGRVNYRESDLIVQLFTDGLGRISALARGSRKSNKRFSGALEPMHTLRVELSDKPRGELYTLKDARLTHPRTHLTSHLDGLSAAGKALNWVRKVAPHHTPEAELWRAITLLLDELDKPEEVEQPERLLAGFGTRLLEVLGWGLHLVSCVSCGKHCPPGRAAWIHPERGGIICQRCGGGPIRLAGLTREELIRASRNDGVRISATAVGDVLRVVERALSAHMGLSETSTSDLGRRLK